MSVKLKFNFITRDGKKIPVYEKTQLPKGHLEALNKRFQDEPGIDYERRQADEGYNCHGMTFIGKLGWVGWSNSQESIIILPDEATDSEAQEGEEDIIEKILKGNGLRRSFRLDNYDVDFLKADEDVDVGDIVVYKDVRKRGEEILHTAIVTELIKADNKVCNLRVLSKMGYGGEYFHLFNNAPKEFGKIIEIWTDREEK